MWPHRSSWKAGSVNTVMISLKLKLNLAIVTGLCMFVGGVATGIALGSWVGYPIAAVGWVVILVAGVIRFVATDESPAE